MAGSSGFTVPVPAGAVSLTVTGMFTVPYQVSPSPNWETDVGIAGKTEDGFVATFTVPAPVDALLDYVIEEE